MRLLVTGSRNWRDADLLFEVLDEINEDQHIECIIEGEAPGADQLARAWAERHHVPVRAYPANWQKHGKAAGHIRNQQMLVEGQPDHVVAFPMRDSKGTWDMVNQAMAAGVTTEVIDSYDNVGPGG